MGKIIKDEYKEQERRWRCEEIRLREALANAQARVDYYRRRIAVINHGPLVLEVAE